MKRRFIASVSIFLALVLCLAACGGGGSGSSAGNGEEEMYELIISTGERDPGAMVNGFRAAAKFLEDTGKFKVTVYVSGAFTSGESEGLQQVQDNEIQMSFASAYTLGNAAQVPGFFVYDYPFFIETKEDYMKITSSDLMKECADQVREKLNVHLGRGWYNGPFVLGTVKFPLEDLDDFKGLKVRTPSSPVILDYVVKLGMTPVSMIATEAYTALQQGAVDGAYTAEHIFTDFRWDEICHYYYLDGGFGPVMVPIFSNTYYQSVPDDIKAILDEALMVFSDTSFNEATKADKETENKVIDRGDPFLYAPADQQAELRALGESILVEMADIAGQENIDRVKEILGR